MLPLSPVARWLRTKWLGSKSLRGLWGRLNNSPYPEGWTRATAQHLYLERLEDRTMLTAVPPVTGSDVKFLSAHSSDKVYLPTSPSSPNKVQWSSDGVDATYQDLANLTLSAGQSNTFTFQM